MTLHKVLITQLQGRHMPRTTSQIVIRYSLSSHLLRKVAREVMQLINSKNLTTARIKPSILRIYQAGSAPVETNHTYMMQFRPSAISLVDFSQTTKLKDLANFQTYPCKAVSILKGSSILVTKRVKIRGFKQEASKSLLTTNATHQAKPLLLKKILWIASAALRKN